ncbi:MAG: hypothetical protein ACQEXN_15060 [Actinomycetota bacterium]
MAAVVTSGRPTAGPIAATVVILASLLLFFVTDNALVVVAVAGAVVFSLFGLQMSKWYSIPSGLGTLLLLLLAALMIPMWTGG